MDRTHRGMQTSLASAKYASWTTHAFLQSAIFPSVNAALRMNETLAHQFVDVAVDEGRPREFLTNTKDRVAAAKRMRKVITSLGKELFGSARFVGETVIAEDAHFKVSWLPPRGPDRGHALFHSGGCIPYGDALFRLTPSHNLFQPILDAGVGVYAMELKGDADENDYSRLTMPGLIDAIARLSDAAFDHHGRRKMILEGYCGQGTQTLTYACARPEDADKKFSVLAMFVTPVDGTRCGSIADAIKLQPGPILDKSFELLSARSGYMPPDAHRMHLDLSLSTTFDKTNLGYFYSGFLRPDLGHADSVHELSDNQKRDLAGAYWISPDCARRYPIPLDIARFTTALFRDGLGGKAELPMNYDGRPVTLSALATKTNLQVIGFYGGCDPVTPDATAHLLIDLLGARYQHIVHHTAGHISYVLSPRMWKPGGRRSLVPNPIDIMLRAGGADTHDEAGLQIEPSGRR